MKTFVRTNRAVVFAAGIMMICVHAKAADRIALLPVPAFDWAKWKAPASRSYSRDSIFINRHNSSQPPAPAPPAQTAGRQRSKGLIWAGLAMIGGGAALAIANPDTSEYILGSRGQLYKKSYNYRIAGAAIAGGGGFVLWRGLRGK